ncbi:shikimate kinase [Alloprevotella rava F0323]|uniref:Shikimate kinase n=1 Tax=Alloprevotella rava F0323 TaxID=679199 RepID=G5GCH8_9BACT|nr:shikimate kinase [Alloprevotella rava]EHG22757.1 shikimate kinase [Alloprevotella rava F0323]
MKAIILIGYMCVGKTTIGKELAKRRGQMFYDLDWYIEERFRKRVPQIFAEEGEEAFRKKERNMLHEVAEFENVVVSCGGGTPCFFDNIDYMNQAAEVIYLKASPETILSHLKISKGKRPLLEGMRPEELQAFVTDQLKMREDFYLRARHVVDVDVLDSAEKINRLVELIETEIK